MNQAVIDGVNIYRYSPQDLLRGCVIDAQGYNLTALNYLEFNPDGITLLLDYQAEAARIQDKTWNMVTKSKGGNHLLWTHSSHGTNDPDPTQADGMEELLCCYDTREKEGRWDRDTVISAKFIGDVAAAVHPEDHMDIILDCCYAPNGSQLKAMGLSYAKARFLRRSMAEKVMATSAGKKTVMPPNVCLWSACASFQTSADAYIDEKWQGAFSAAWRMFFKIGRSRSDIMFYARKWLDGKFDQVPHLYGVDLAGKSF